jgi:hypothetical protein
MASPRATERRVLPASLRPCRQRYRIVGAPQAVDGTARLLATAPAPIVSGSLQQLHLLAGGVSLDKNATLAGINPGGPRRLLSGCSTSRNARTVIVAAADPKT